MADSHHIWRTKEVNHVDYDKNRHGIVQRSPLEKQGKGEAEGQAGDGKGGHIQAVGDLFHGLEAAFVPHIHIAGGQH